MSKKKRSQQKVLWSPDAENPYYTACSSGSELHFTLECGHQVRTHVKVTAGVPKTYICPKGCR